MTRRLLLENYKSDADVDGGELTAVALTPGIARHIKGLYIKFLLSYSMEIQQGRPWRVSYFYQPYDVLAFASDKTTHPAWMYLAEMAMDCGESGLVCNIKGERFINGQLPISRGSVHEMHLKQDGSINFETTLKHSDILCQTPDIHIDRLCELSGVTPIGDSSLRIQQMAMAGLGVNAYHIFLD